LHLELIRLRAELLSEEKPTAREKRHITQGLRDIKRDRYVRLAELRKELGS